MAVLKDLIVHGPSKFIGKTQFNTINARSIGAKEGIFEKLIATTLNAETATIDDLTAQNATVVGLMDVQGELHTNAWTNANIANIGGSFYISPSVETVSGTITINKNTSNWTVQITGNFATDFIKTAGATTASAWPVDSLVLVTGNIVVNNMDYPLGTLKGKLTAQVAASAASTSKTITMTCASTYVDNPNADVLQMLYEANGNANITNAAFSNGKISMYKISGTKPIGILLSSVGITAKGSNYIDIYGGTNNDGTPNLRIGHLTGLPAISLNGRSMTPTGWGLYADNAYLSGTIHSAAGIIGGFTIDSNSLHNGTFGTANSVLVSTGTSSAANIAGSGSISGWAFTAGTTYGVTKTGALYATSGSIAGWNFNSTSLYKNSATPGASASAMVISTGTASTNNIGGGGTASKTWMLSAGTGFGVTTSGVLYATGAQISGKITANEGMIGGFHISNSANTGTSANGGHFYTTSLYAQSGDGTYEYEVGMKGDGNSTTDQSGNLAFYVKRMTKGASWSSATNIFYITKGGTLYAQSADITGKITATSGSFSGAITTSNIKATGGTIGGWSIGSDSISKANSVTSGTASTQYQTLLNAPTVSNTTYAVYVRHRSYDGSAYGSWTNNFLIRYDGYVYARNIETVGGKIGGFAIDSTSIHTNGVAVTSNADNSIALSSADFTRTINGTSRAGLRFAIGDKFGVTGDGAIYASSADITGKITANNGYIGGTSGWTIASQQLYNGTIGADNSLHLGTKNLGSNTSIAGRSGSDWRLTVGSKFGVTNTGAFYASAGAIGNSVTIGGTAASTVLSDISTAQSTANTAKTNAATAQSTADTAKTNAATAQSTANTANTNATNAAKTATNYIANIDSNSGITIKAINGTTDTNTITGNYIKLNASGMEIYNKGSSVAFYGTTARIGKSNSSRFLMNADSLEGYNSSNKRYFQVSASGLKYGTDLANTVETTTGAQSKADAAKNSAVSTAASDATTKANNAAKTATTYITDIDSNNGITLKPSTKTGNDYLQINSTDIRFVRNNVDVMNLTDSAFRIGTASSGHSTVKSDGLHIWKGVETTPSNEVASFTGTEINLGKNSTASKIKLCGNKGTISSYDGGINIESSVVYLEANDDSDNGSSSVHVGRGNILIASESVNLNGVSITLDCDETLGESTMAVDADWIELDRGSIYMMDGNAPAKASQTANAIWAKNSYGNYRLCQPSSSSRRYKEDIQPVIDDRLDPHRLYNIPVMQFKFKEGYFEQDDPYELDRKDVVGLIAEDVYEQYPQAAIMMDNEVENWDERYIIPPMLKLIQEQHEQIQALTERIEELERR